MADEMLTARLVAFLGPMAMCLALGGPLIRALRGMGFGQRVRDDGPQQHLQKEGTPTMGGVMIVGTTVLGAALGAWLMGGQGSAPMRWALLGGAAMVGFGGIGFADDWLKVRRGRSLGLKARQKLGLQLAVSLGFVYVVAGHGHAGVAGAAWAVFWGLAMVATSNAVNLADGLDGLAAGLCAIAALAFAWLGTAAGQNGAAVFSLATAGACLGFLWFNRHPARLFMGDVGSLALGGALAGCAAMLNSPLALVGLCLVAFVEEASVIAQVVSFKTTGKRVFRMSPIHHHFELSGWSEQRVVWTFWGVALAAAVATVALHPQWPG